MLFVETAFYVCKTNISSHKVTFQAVGISLINLSIKYFKTSAPPGGGDGGDADFLRKSIFVGAIINRPL